MSENKLSRRNFAIYISDNSATKKNFFKIYYDNLFLNYFTRARTENAICRKYFWLNILFKIEKYIRICSNCQRVRVHHYKSYDEFNFILSNDKISFYTIIMNFIIDMSSTRNLYINKTCDTILMLMNKLIKHVMYIAIIKKLNAKNFVQLFWRKFISHHDIMLDIISNRNLLFINHFWSTLYWH